MEARIVEKRTQDGRYGINTDSMILDTTEHGRLLITDGWGGDEVNGECYRWRHGLAIKLKSNDAFDKLDGAWNDTTTVLQAVLNGYDTERPILEWDGNLIARVARKYFNQKS